MIMNCQGRPHSAPPSTRATLNRTVRVVRAVFPFGISEGTLGLCRPTYYIR